MRRSYITFYDESGGTVGQMVFTYGKSVYKGKTELKGPIAKGLQKTFDSKPSLYVPDLGGAGARHEGSKAAWSWLVAIAIYVTKGRNRLAASFKVKSPPPKRLFKQTDYPPGALP